MKLTTLLAIAVLGGSFAALGGCDEPTPDPGTSAVSTTDSTTPPATEGQYDSKLAGDADQKGADTSASVEDRKPKDGDEVAVLDTEKGKIVLMFFPDKAPNHVKNFLDLAKKGFYDGTRFHRTIPGFMIQGGDPNTKQDDKSSWGQGGSGKNIDAEFNDIHHVAGIVSMARASDPNSASSQFFIVVGDAGFLDGQYTAFGKVVEGQDVADAIVALPNSGPPSNTAVNPVKVKSIKIEKWPLKK
jgi:peptidyl-prolyl cis-trans isomerase B (cyclophilin B)